MCYCEKHSCACTEIPGLKWKMVHRRVVMCPDNSEESKTCPFRNAPQADYTAMTQVIIRLCENFHRGDLPLTPYRCAVDRIDRQGLQTMRLPNSDEHRQTVLRWMDVDCISSLDHLALTDASEKTSFNKSTMDSGDAIAPDEYCDIRYVTGWKYKKGEHGVFHKVRDGNVRGMITGNDPSLDTLTIDGMRRRMEMLFESDGGASEGDNDDDETGTVVAVGGVPGNAFAQQIAQQRS